METTKETTMETSAMNAYVRSWKNPKKFFIGEGQYDYVFMCLVSELWLLQQLPGAS